MCVRVLLLVVVIVAVHLYEWQVERVGIAGPKSCVKIDGIRRKFMRNDFRSCPFLFRIFFSLLVALYDNIYGAMDVIYILCII